MEHTKERSNYRTKEKTYRFIAFCLCIGLILNLMPVHMAKAAGITIYNDTTGQTMTYSGTQVSYLANGTSVELNGTPGIIMSNGAALASYYDVFKTALGVDCTYRSSDGTITFSEGNNRLVLTLGSKTAVLNGETVQMSNAPVKLKFLDSGKVKVYVPTRFVAEALGFEYYWNSTTATSSIRRSISLTEYGVQSEYKGDFISVSIDGEPISYGVFPGIIKDGSALVRIKQTFANSPVQAEYTYDKKDKSILLVKDAISIRMSVGSNVAYVNDVKYIMETEATVITCNKNQTSYVMVPLEFVAEKLGYEVSFQKEKQSYNLITTENTGVAAEITVAEAEKTDITGGTTQEKAELGEAEPLFSATYFNWKADEAKLQYYTAYEDNLLSGLAAVSCKNSDALILYGISTEQLKFTDDTNFVTLTAEGVRNLVAGEFYYEPSNSYLNYCISDQKEDTLIISVLKMQDLAYYMYDMEEGCVVHFTSRFEELPKDSIVSETENGNAKAPEENPEGSVEGTGTEEGAESAESETVSLPDDCFLLKLPDGITKNDLLDADSYETCSFTISIPGNYVDFLYAQEARNPYGVLKAYTFTYRAADNRTVLTFTTKKLQGYSYDVIGSYLVLKIAAPSEIYDKIVVLDAGHGGIDPGASKNGVTEKQINFNVLNRYAKEYFDASDIKVYYTRTTDTKIDLYERAAFAEKVGADLFISFHVNANNSSSVHGTSVYYSTNNNETTASGLNSKILAEVALQEMVDALETKNRGVLTERFVVVHYNTVPAILIESAFITNASDFEKLTNEVYQKKAAKAIFDAVTKLFEQYPTGRDSFASFKAEN